MPPKKCSTCARQCDGIDGMFPPRRVLLTLSLWLSGMAACPAQEAPSPARSHWSTLFETTPVLWGCIFIAIIVAAALLIQVVFVLKKSRVIPNAFIDAFTHAIQTGNYQEAWETCNRWRQAAVARMLQPALERIGQGRGPVESRLVDQSRLELRNVHLQLWCMLAGAAIAAVLCAIGIVAEMRAVALATISPDGPRALALAVGDITMLAALAVAVLVPAFAAWYVLRAKAARLLQAAEEEGILLLAPLPYEEIEGVRIGLDFHAGSMLGDTADSSAKRLQVSRELTTLCPSCNGPINSSRNNCPHCGQLFTWS